VVAAARAASPRWSPTYRPGFVVASRALLQYALNDGGLSARAQFNRSRICLSLRRRVPTANTKSLAAAHRFELFDKKQPCLLHCNVRHLRQTVQASQAHPACRRDDA